METKSHKVLIVDDEPDILDLMEYNLKKDGYKVKSVNNGRKALEIIPDFKPDVILLDIMMPHLDGIETCRKIKEIPDIGEPYILFLTARSEEYSEIAAFDSGADDYITKPIKPRALMSRINAIFRKADKQKETNSKIEIGNLSIDRNSYIVVFNEVQIVLPKKEFELLFFLAKNADKVYSREDLLQNIWGADVFVVPRTVDVHIRKLREKLGDKYITTVKGVGYKFTVEEK